MKLYTNKHTYLQSFLIKDNVNFNDVFDVKLSSIKLESNISNNRHSFTTNLKTEKLDIALISGALNYNSRAIISKIDNNLPLLLGGGIKEHVRLSKSDPTMWSDIFINNSNNIKKTVTRIQKNISKIKILIEKSEKEKLKVLLKKIQSKTS